MKSHKVTVLEPFPSPFFWNDFRGKKYILEADQREINGKAIKVEEDPQTKIIVFGSWEPHAQDYNSYLLKQIKDDRIRHLLPIVRRGKIKRDRAANLKFNEALNIPVNWSSEIKEVLSGLNINSMGNGTKKNTVFHIYLKERLEAGKLKRDANNFLCSPVKSKHFGDWSGSLGDDGQEAKVTCKSCLKFAERFNINEIK